MCRKEISSVPSLLGIGFDDQACRATRAPGQSDWHNVDISPRPANLVPAIKNALALPLATLERHGVPDVRNRALPPTAVHISGAVKPVGDTANGPDVEKASPTWCKEALPAPCATVDEQATGWQLAVGSDKY
ncbi:hypothetical protein BST61_g9847 [Cercospora zeina]